MKSDSQISITVYPFDSRYDLRSMVLVLMIARRGWR